MSDRIETKLLLENLAVPFSFGMTAASADAAAMAEAERIIKQRIGRPPTEIKVRRRSVDARRKGAVRIVYSIYASVGVAQDFDASTSGFKSFTEGKFEFTPGLRRMNKRPLVVGFGPAGMFCAMALAENGYKPLVLERGDPVCDRIKNVERFLKGGKLDYDSNIQFGAGGAGTFSDGKLTTRIGDPLVSYVLSRLVFLGAPEDIEYKAKPHIGTDVLVGVVEKADQFVREHGGEIKYRTTAHICGRYVSVNGEKIDSDAVVLALGHSARDTYTELIDSGYSIEAKPYSAGVRIEHLQRDIDEAMFGNLAGDPVLGHAEYQLSMRRGNRGVYSFCMCPGGEVVAAASEDGGVVTNGMSRRMRDGKNSNAAIAVSVLPEDFDGTPERAIEFQRTLERAAFDAGGSTFAAPAQTVGDFLSGDSGTRPCRILPTYRGGDVAMCDLHRILPSFIGGMLEDGIRFFGSRINGFDVPDAILTGVETRTSAPIRILRNGSCKALGRDGIYPCGEGAGYAGGIVSAAIDGLRTARAIMEEYAPIE